MSETRGQVVSFEMAPDLMALVERALRFTVGQEAGGTGTEGFGDEERRVMLGLADAIGLARRDLDEDA